MRIELNPPGVDETILMGLNEAFPGWGDAGRYAWYFSARPPFSTPDLLVASLDGSIVGATGITFRHTAMGPGSPELVGILTGSWTRRQFRGRGVFRHLVDEAFARVFERGGRALLGFVRNTSPALSTLIRAGSECYPSHYLTSNGNPQAAQRLQAHRSDRGLECLQRALSQPARGTVFFYDGIDSVRAQFLNRPDPVETWTLGGSMAIIANRGDQFEVLKLLETPPEATGPFLRALADEAAARGGHLVLYTTEATLEDAARSQGFTCADGALTCLRRSDDRRSTEWVVCGGDRS